MYFIEVFAMNINYKKCIEYCERKLNKLPKDKRRLRRCRREIKKLKRHVEADNERRCREYEKQPWKIHFAHWGLQVKAPGLDFTNYL